MNKLSSYMNGFSSLFLVCLCLIVMSCQSKETEPGERVIAEVYGKRLKAKEVNAFIPNEASEADSMAIAQAYMERWIKEALLLREAEKSISRDIAIDQLVSRYRSSLIMSNFEKLYVEQNLDTLITAEELETYYEDNKYQYQLETTILKCRFLKVDRAITPIDYEFLKKEWSGTKPPVVRRLKKICSEFGEQCFFEEEMDWLKLESLKSMMPEGAINDNIIKYNQTFQLKDPDFYYFLKIYEQVSDKEVAPFSFIEEQARRYILHQRKLVLLDKMREDLYEKELDLNNVIIYKD